MTADPLMARGLRCAVAHYPAPRGASRIIVSVEDDDRNDGAPHYTLTLIHADGIALTATLSDSALDRLAHILVAAWEGDYAAPIGGVPCIR